MQQAAVMKDEKLFDILRIVNGLCLTVLHRIERRLIQIVCPTEILFPTSHLA